MSEGKRFETDILTGKSNGGKVHVRVFDNGNMSLAPVESRSVRPALSLRSGHSRG
jgi:hypothetical protein